MWRDYRADAANVDASNAMRVCNKRPTPQAGALIPTTDNVERAANSLVVSYNDGYILSTWRTLSTLWINHQITRIPKQDSTRTSKVNFSQSQQLYMYAGRLVTPSI